MTNLSEHPIVDGGQTIRMVVVFESEYAHETYQVGVKGVTRIEATIKSGMYANIAYVRIWQGDNAIAEFCQHNVRGVYFDVPEKP